MRKRNLQAAFVVILLLASTLVACATPIFKLSATVCGPNQWAYVFTNNSTNYESAIAFTLHWDPLSPQTDLVAAQENFDPYGGYVKVPTGWVGNTGSYPVCASTNMFTYKVTPGTSLTGLKLCYGTLLNPYPVAPTWFVVNYMIGTTQQATSWQPITDAPLAPEASGVLTLLAGITGIGFAGIRRCTAFIGKKKD
jgi:hypothetical protein